MELKTFNSKILEDIVHLILHRYRGNSSREHLKCSLDYIKNIIIDTGTLSNTLSSSNEDISREELIEKLLENIK